MHFTASVSTLSADSVDSLTGAPGSSSEPAVGIIELEEVGGETARRAAPWDGASTASPIPPQSPPSRSSRGETRNSAGCQDAVPGPGGGACPVPRVLRGGRAEPEPLLAQSPGAANPGARSSRLPRPPGPTGAGTADPGISAPSSGRTWPGRRWRAAPGPTKTSPRHASRPASVSLSPQECRNPRYQPRSTPDLNDLQRTELTLAAEPSPRPAGRP